MYRGCISLGDIQCNKCHHVIPHSDRYLAIDEEDGVQVEKDKTGYYCVECALQEGYAYYKDGEKDEGILTFLP
ncbi:hypothetical protein ACFLUR_02580 [Chloroflexota bacterium]